MKRKICLFLIFPVICICLYAQNKIVIHRTGNVTFESLLTNVDSIKFSGTSSFFNFKNGLQEIPVSEIDSVTFAEYTQPYGDVVEIRYNGTLVEVINPLAENGVNIAVDGAKVTVTALSAIRNISYNLSGSSDNGSLIIGSNDPVILNLNDLNLTNVSGPAINITKNIAATVNISGSNYLSDGTSSTQNATLLSKGMLVFGGEGSLNIKGLVKHAISSSQFIEVNGATITIPHSESDGFHSEGFVMNNGSLDIQATVGDGIDAGSGYIEINNGNIKFTSSTADIKGLKSDENIIINGGTLNLTVTGGQSKGISGKKNVTFNGGVIGIVASGSAVLTSVNKGYTPSYCTAVKCDSNLVVNNGTFNIELKSANLGGKGFSADGNIVINNGNITISTAGNGATYTNESGTKDSYTSCCIKSDKNIELIGGKITCSSSGTGGKGIVADGTLIIGAVGANNDNLTINVSTSGERFLVSGSGNSADYANPKAIKSLGNLTVNSGNVTVKCTQKADGGEGLESKATLTINGGLLELETYDDCINAAKNITINGGITYCTASNNDGIDSNGTLTITGGFTISNGARAPEEGFDCDNNTFKITGGTIVGTGGATSNPTASVCTQRSIKYTGTAGNAICIKNASGEIILIYQLPAFTGTTSVPGGGGPGGGGPGGSSSSMVVLFTDPRLANGTYTLLYGGTISDGTTVHGYNTGGTYSGGSTKTFTVSSMLTTVQ